MNVSDCLAVRVHQKQIVEQKSNLEPAIFFSLLHSLSVCLFLSLSLMASINIHQCHGTLLDSAELRDSAASILSTRLFHLRQPPIESVDKSLESARLASA